MPIKSLDQPAAMGGSYKDNSDEELLRDVIDGEEIEGADDSLAVRMNSRIKEDVLQHDINTVLFTLPARERNVSSPSSSLPPRIFCINEGCNLCSWSAVLLRFIRRITRFRPTSHLRVGIEPWAEVA